MALLLHYRIAIHLCPVHRLLLFASGRGSNADAIIQYFKETGTAKVVLIACNKPGAGVLDLAAREGIPTLVFDRAAMQSEDFLARLQAEKPTLLLLAGFLWKIPDAVVQAFPDRILNIHPALLPRHGGKGMWGHHVHNAVLDAGESESGITIHRVNERYDEGAILVQARCPVMPGDDADALAARIHGLEHFYYPRVVDFCLQNLPA